MTTKLSTESLDDYGNTDGVVWLIQVPVVTQYTVFSMPFKGTIVEANYATSTGTATFSVKVNSTTVTGLSALGASSTPASATATANNTFNAGNNLVVDVTAIGSSPENLSVSLKILKTRD